MDLIEVLSNGNEQLLAAGLTPGEVDEVLDWWRYTKPLGSGVKTLVRENSGVAFRLTTAGAEVETIHPLADLTRSEVSIG